MTDGQAQMAHVLRDLPAGSAHFSSGAEKVEVRLQPDDVGDETAAQQARGYKFVRRPGPSGQIKS